MALVPITLQAPDGGVTVAYQLQPVPPFPPQDTGLTDVSGSILSLVTQQLCHEFQCLSCRKLLLSPSNQATQNFVGIDALFGSLRFVYV